MSPRSQDHQAVRLFRLFPVIPTFLAQPDARRRPRGRAVVIHPVLPTIFRGSMRFLRPRGLSPETSAPRRPSPRRRCGITTTGAPLTTDYEIRRSAPKNLTDAKESWRPVKAWTDYSHERPAPASMRSGVIGSAQAAAMGDGPARGPSASRPAPACLPTYPGRSRCRNPSQPGGRIAGASPPVSACPPPLVHQSTRPTITLRSPPRLPYAALKYHADQAARRRRPLALLTRLPMSP